jgi:hypothetical protein
VQIELLPYQRNVHGQASRYPSIFVIKNAISLISRLIAKLQPPKYSDGAQLDSITALGLSTLTQFPTFFKMPSSSLQFATPEPANAIAKLSLSDMYNIKLQQHTETNVYLYTDDTPLTDDQVAVLFCAPSPKRLVLAMPHNRQINFPSESACDDDQTLTESVMIWRCHFAFHLKLPPETPKLGWMMGTSTNRS